MGRLAKAAAPVLAPVPPVPVVKRKAPDFTGVPGELVELATDLQFGATGRISPYDALLDKLRAATDVWLSTDRAKPQPGLKFGAVQARVSVCSRAKKKGLKVAFCESGGALFVRIDAQAGIEKHSARRTTILQTLKITVPQNSYRLCEKLRAAGDATIDVPSVEAICVQLMREGSIVRQEGDNWALNARKAPAAPAAK